jgi:hypothetical protein
MRSISEAFHLKKKKGKTYWSELSDLDRATCVGARLTNTQYDGKDASLPAGPLNNRWNNELRTTIKAICDDEANQARVYEKLTVHRPRSYHLFLLSPTNGAGSAVPTIVVISSDKKVAKRTLAIIQGHPRIKSLNLGFCFLAHEDKITLETSTRTARPPQAGSHYSLTAGPSELPTST